MEIESEEDGVEVKAFTARSLITGKRMENKFEVCIGEEYNVSTCYVLKT